MCAGSQRNTGTGADSSFKINEMNVSDKIIANEKAHICLTSTVIQIGENLVRYNDDRLPDMYDSNFFEAKRQITEEDYVQMLEYKEKRGERHLKAVCCEPSELLSEKGLETGILLTMMKTDRDYPDRCRHSLRFTNLKDENIKKDLTGLEVKHYAEAYGMDFTLRKCSRFYDAAREGGNGLNYYAAYLGETIVASCSAFFSHDVVEFDNLLTDRDHRHQGIATALMSYVHSRFGCPMFLHAEEDDTPKEMYRNMGFFTVKTVYEYLRTD